MKTSLFTRLILAIFAAFMIAGTAQAQNAILVVDSGKVLRDSSAGKSVVAQLAAIQKTIEVEAQSAINPLKGEQASIQQQMEGLSQTELQSNTTLAAQIRSYQERGAKAQTEMQYKGAELQATEQKAKLEVAKKIDSVIADLARERGAAVVLEKSLMLYSSSAVDVTADVVARLNREMPSITVTRERLPRNP